MKTIISFLVFAVIFQLAEPFEENVKKQEIITKIYGCGYPDNLKYDNPKYDNNRYAVSSVALTKTNLTYSLGTGSSKLSDSVVLENLRYAFDVWETSGRLKFTYVNSSSADIVLSFKTGDHGDGYNFNEDGNQLAHAYFPSSIDYRGVIHLDDNQDWVVKTADMEHGIDFFTVAVHEIGHTLGVHHSAVEDAIMYESYGIVRKPGMRLPYDDKKAIHALYPKKCDELSTLAPFFPV